MIQELKISNFLSFKEEVTLSFEATKDNTFEDYQVVEVAQGVRLLRFAVVYGANASGKSNLLSAINFLHNFWFDKKHDNTEETNVIPFKLDSLTPNQSSHFSLKFYVGDIKYWYQLELDEKTVLAERMFYYNSAQPTLLFDRKIENKISVINFNPGAIKISAIAKEEINLKCLTNMSFFAASNQVNVALPKIDDARDWMQNNIMETVDPRTRLFDFAERLIQEDEKLKKHLLCFIQKADFNISSLNTKLEKHDVPQEFVDILLKVDSMPEDERERLKNEKNITRIKTDFEHTVLNERGKEKYLLEDSLESEGTRRVIGIETALYSALQKNALIAIDEIESSLHPDLIIYILKKFLENKSNRAQLLITSHYDPLLSEIGELFRKDSIWFTEKNEAGSTELFSLVEFNGLNRIASLQKAYRQGRFGAIPRINL
jgi:AAA15 family ATPase/GTPase